MLLTIFRIFQLFLIKHTEQYFEFLWCFKGHSNLKQCFPTSISVELNLHSSSNFKSYFDSLVDSWGLTMLIDVLVDKLDPVWRERDWWLWMLKWISSNCAHEVRHEYFADCVAVPSELQVEGDGTPQDHNFRSHSIRRGPLPCSWHDKRALSCYYFSDRHTCLSCKPLSYHT